VGYLHNQAENPADITEDEILQCPLTLVSPPLIDPSRYDYKKYISSSDKIIKKE
jgi:hypothetical protein